MYMYIICVCVCVYRFASINNSICCHGYKGRDGTKEGKNINNTNGSAIERFVVL